MHRYIIVLILTAALISGCTEPGPESSTSPQAEDMAESDRDAVDSSGVVCEEQSPDKCACRILRGQSFDKTEGCFRELEPYRCTEDPTRGGGTTYAIDPSGNCWKFPFTFISEIDGYDFSDLRSGWNLIEPGVDVHECFDAPGC